MCHRQHVCVTQRRVISLAVVQRDGAIREGHVGVEGPKALLLSFRNQDSNVGVHVGFEGNLDAL